MSTISNTYSAASAYSSYPLTSTGGYGQGSQDSSSSASNGVSVPSNDLTPAQKALLAQQTAGNIKPSGSNATGTTGTIDPSTLEPFTNNTQARQDYRKLVKDLGSGDLDAARKDIANLQTDLKLHGPHKEAQQPQGVTTNPATDGVVTVSEATSSDSTSGNVINVTV